MPAACKRSEPLRHRDLQEAAIGRLPTTVKRVGERLPPGARSVDRTPGQDVMASHYRSERRNPDLCASFSERKQNSGFVFL